jgi:hypothetical protein
LNFSSDSFFSNRRWLVVLFYLFNLAPGSVKGFLVMRREDFAGCWQISLGRDYISKPVDRVTHLEANPTNRQLQCQRCKKTATLQKALSFPRKKNIFTALKNS